MKFKLIYILTLLTLLYISCKKDEDRNYPTINSISVKNITSDGISINFSIDNSGKYKVTDLGVMWSENKSFPSNNTIIKKLSLDDITSNYTANITTDLIEGTKYFIKPYISNKFFTIHGKTQSFISKGSKEFKLKEFYPRTAVWNDTITLLGESFSLDTTKIGVKFNNHDSKIVYFSSDSLKVIIPSELDSVNSDINITIASTKNYSNKFQITPPIITGFEPKQGKYGDKITITGKNFNPNHSKIKINGSNMKVWYSSDQTKLITQIPEGLSAGQYPISVRVLSQETKYDNTLFTCTSPTIDTITPNPVKLGEYIFLKTENVTNSYPEVYINNLKQEYVYSSNSTIKVKVPEDLNTQSPLAYLKFSYYSSNKYTFHINDFSISDINPKYVSYGDTITIEGANFSKSTETKILFNDEEGEVVSRNLNKIRAIIPNSTGSTSGNITVSYNQFNILKHFDSKLTIKESKITGISSSDLYYKDTVTVYGENFPLNNENNKLFLNDISATAFKSYKDSLKFIIPFHQLHGSKTISFEISGKTMTNSFDVMYNQPWKRLNDIQFNLDTRSFFTFKNRAFLIGRTRYTREINLYEYDSVKDEWNKHFEVPMMYLNFHIEMSDYVYLSFKKECWKLYPATMQMVKVNPLNTDFQTPSINFKCDGKAIAGIQNLYIYDELNDTWILHDNFDEKYYSMNSFTYNDKGYSIANKVDHSMTVKFHYEGLKKYDHISKSWEEISYDPVMEITGPIEFIINDNLYFGLGREIKPPYSSWTDPVTKLYKINMKSLEIKRVANMPGYPRNGTKYFIINNKAYLGYGFFEHHGNAIDFWEFDPSKLKPE